jgi:hypothetical protein
MYRVAIISGIVLESFGPQTLKLLELILVQFILFYNHIKDLFSHYYIYLSNLKKEFNYKFFEINLHIIQLLIKPFFDLLFFLNMHFSKIIQLEYHNSFHKIYHIFFIKDKSNWIFKVIFYFWILVWLDRNFPNLTNS